MRKFLPLIQERTGLFLAGLLTATASGLFTAEVILIIKEGLEQNIDDTFLLKVIGYSIIAASLGVLSSYFTAKMTNIISRDLTKNLSKDILEAEYEYIESMSDTILPVMTRDIRYLAFFINKFPQFVIAVTTLMITLIRMFLIDAELTAYFVVVLIMQALLLIVLVPIFKKYTLRARKYDNLVYGGLSDMVSGLKELTLNKEKRDAFIGQVIIKDLKSMTSLQIRSRVINGLSERLTELITFVFMAIFMYLCIYHISVDFDRFKVFLPIILFIVPFMGKISGFIRDSKEAEVSLSQIQLLGVNISKKKIDSREEIKNLETNESEIVAFENITYSYSNEQHDRKLVFGPLNLKIERGNITFIIGGNGSGKTTFAKLLTGLYIPTGGNIKFQKDTTINKKNLLSYRQLFSAYFADSYTFKHLYHIDESFLSEKGGEFLQLLEMENKVSIQNKEFSTTQLSYGQRSRLALVSNMLDDKKIYLFDEWAANQDPYFKAIFYKEILPYLKKIGKTVIVISHDEKYFEHADTIIELKEGMVC